MSSNDASSTAAAAGTPKPSPRWWAPVMVTLMLIGLLWIVTFYLTNREYPIESIGNWNMGIGFGFIMLGFGMTANWR